jgi:hypothetical protein
MRLYLCRVDAARAFLKLWPITIFTGVHCILRDPKDLAVSASFITWLPKYTYAFELLFLLVEFPDTLREEKFISMDFQVLHSRLRHGAALLDQNKKVLLTMKRLATILVPLSEKIKPRD